MSQKFLVTQGELKNTITGLGALADNLNDHVNASMSKSHGWTGMQALYQDSGGCYHSGPVGPITNQRVLRIAVGPNIYYAPAQLSGGIDGYPDPVLPPYTGIISPQQADPSMDLSVGYPVQSALVTTFAAPLNIIAGAADTTLLTHAGSPPETAHGGLSSSVLYKRDTAAHIVGRRSVNLLINGARWMIVCDQTQGGPTQGPRFANACPQIIAYYGESSFTYQGNCTWKDEAPDGKGQQTYCAELICYGTPPIAYKWEYTTNATNPTWTTLVNGSHYNANNGFDFTVLYSGHTAGAAWITPPSVGTISTPPPASTSLRIAIQNYGSSRNGTNFAYGIRCTLDNSSIQDGAVVHSDMLIMAMIDHTGCC
jgi:hypothetical protein